MTNRLQAVFLAGILAFTLPAGAATTWSLAPTDTGCGVTGPNLSVCTNLTGPVASIAGYAGDNVSASNTLSSRPVNWYNSAPHIGWGVGNRDATPPIGSGTAIDSTAGGTTDFEMVLLSFSSKVNLTAINIGYNGSDDVATGGNIPLRSDMSVLAYTGTGTPIVAGTTSWNTLNTPASGWTIIGNYANVGGSNGAAPGGTANIAGQSTGIFSSYWLIGAYNGFMGGSSYCASGATGCSVTASPTDLFKVVSVEGVPEPGTLALFAAAALGMFSMGKRRKA